MISISVFFKNGSIAGFEAEGHSGFGVKGQDIVCSAVSSILETWVLGCIKVFEKGPAVQKSDGYLKLLLKDEDVADNCFQKASRVFLMALKEIERTYPDRVKVSAVEID